MKQKSIQEANYHTNKKRYDDLWIDNCPLCDTDSQSQKDIILWRWKHWYILYNKFPYTHTKKHIMAVPYEHKSRSEDIEKELFSELYEVHKFVRSFFEEEDYFSFTRETFAWRSLSHYHIHFLNGTMKGKYLREMLKEQYLF